MPNLFLATPCYGSRVHEAHVDMAVCLYAACLSSNGAWRYGGRVKTDSCNLDWSRNTLVHRAIGHGADWLLMVDADTYQVDAAHTMRMLDLGQESGAAVVAAPVRRRGTDGHNVGKVIAGQMGWLALSEFAGRPITADCVGTAFFAINLGWLREHWPEQPWFLTQHLTGPEPRKIGEDVAFCLEVGKRGGTIVADGRFEPVHATG